MRLAIPTLAACLLASTVPCHAQVPTDFGPKGCVAPGIDLSSEIGFLDLDQGDAASSKAVLKRVGFTNETQEGTTYGEIEVAPGKRPMTLVVRLQRSTIVRFLGDVSRLSRVVITGGPNMGVPLHGAVGVDADKVSFARADCVRDFAILQNRSTEPERGEAGFVAMVGRTPDWIAHATKFSRIRTDDMELRRGNRMTLDDGQSTKVVAGIRGAFLGRVTVSSEEGDPPMFAVDDPRFEVNAKGFLKLKNDVSLPMGTPELRVTVTAMGFAGLPSRTTLTVKVIQQALQRPAPRNASEWLSREAEGEFRSGRVKVDGPVASAMAVDEQPVSPGLLGVKEMVDSGKARVEDVGKARAITFLAETPLPAGGTAWLTTLAGNRTLRLAKGIRPPFGTDAGICILDETGTQVEGNEKACRATGALPPAPAARRLDLNPLVADWKPLDGCRVSRRSPDAEVWAVTGQPGYLSNVAVGSQDDTVKAGRIVVSPGAGKVVLALVAPPQWSEGSLWSVEGEVDRVEAVYLLQQSQRGYPTGSARIGVTGIPSDRVVGVVGEACPKGTVDREGMEAMVIPGLVGTVIGRRPSMVMIAKGETDIALPSGDNAGAPAPTRIRKEPCGSWSSQWDPCGATKAGVLFSRPDAVVTTGEPAREYETLPGAYGLAQLTSQGKIQLVRTQGGPTYVRVLAPIRTPPGGCSFSNFAFSLAPGVPKPTGALCRSCIYSEETNTVSNDDNENKGAFCKALVRGEGGTQTRP